MIATMLNEIVAAGMTEAEIGKAIGRDQSSVNRMRHGRQRPDYDTGVKVEALHREKVVYGAPPIKNRRARAPRIASS